MKTVLIAVDDVRDSNAVLSVFDNLVRPPQKVVLLHVERLEGKSMMIDMLGDAEMSTLREMLQGTEHKEALDKKAEAVLSHYRKAIEDGGLVTVKTVIRDGIPSEEIQKVAEEEDADLIIMGCSVKKGLDRLITGCVSKNVERTAGVPVLLAKSKVKEEPCGLREGLLPTA